MPGRPVVKMQGVGNDFVVVDEAQWPDGDWAARAVALCDRRFGVGADGRLAVSPSAVADARLRQFNPHGTEDLGGHPPLHEPTVLARRPAAGRNVVGSAVLAREHPLGQG